MSSSLLLVSSRPSLVTSSYQGIITSHSFIISEIMTQKNCLCLIIQKGSHHITSNTPSAHGQDIYIKAGGGKSPETGQSCSFFIHTLKMHMFAAFFLAFVHLLSSAPTLLWGWRCCTDDLEAPIGRWLRLHFGPRNFMLGTYNPTALSHWESYTLCSLCLHFLMVGDGCK